MLFLPFRRPLIAPVRLAIAVLLLMLPDFGQLAAQPPAPRTDRFTLLYIVANDTIGVERVERTDSALVGDLTVRGQARIRWTERLTSPRACTRCAWRRGVPVRQRPTRRCSDSCCRCDAIPRMCT